MNIKISQGHGVTEIVENKGIFRVKRNGAKVPEDKIKKIIEVMKERARDCSPSCG